MQDKSKQKKNCPGCTIEGCGLLHRDIKTRKELCLFCVPTIMPDGTIQQILNPKWLEDDQNRKAPSNELEEITNAIPDLINNAVVYNQC